MGGKEHFVYGLAVLALVAAVTGSDEMCFNCANVRNPVCGSNNATYMNMCALRHCSSVNVIFMYAGVCTEPRGVCEPPPEYSPLCGDDGRTYVNKWHLFCSNMTMQYEGECLKQQT